MFILQRLSIKEKRNAKDLQAKLDPSISYNLMLYDRFIDYSKALRILKRSWESVSSTNYLFITWYERPII